MKNKDYVKVTITEIYSSNCKKSKSFNFLYIQVNQEYMNNPFPSFRELLLAIFYWQQVAPKYTENYNHQKESSNSAQSFEDSLSSPQKGG